MPPEACEGREKTGEGRVGRARPERGGKRCTRIPHQAGAGVCCSLWGAAERRGGRSGGGGNGGKEGTPPAPALVFSSLSILTFATTARRGAWGAARRARGTDAREEEASTRCMVCWDEVCGVGTRGGGTEKRIVRQGERRGEARLAALLKTRSPSPSLHSFNSRQAAQGGAAGLLLQLKHTRALTGGGGSLSISQTKARKAKKRSVRRALHPLLSTFNPPLSPSLHSFQSPRGPRPPPWPSPWFWPPPGPPPGPPPPPCCWAACPGGPCP